VAAEHDIRFPGESDEYRRERNRLLNGAESLRYGGLDWRSSVLPDLGSFDLIIGSDLLYESHQPAQLAH